VDETKQNKNETQLKEEKAETRAEAKGIKLERLAPTLSVLMTISPKSALAGFIARLIQADATVEGETDFIVFKEMRAKKEAINAELAALDEDVLAHKIKLISKLLD